MQMEREQIIQKLGDSFLGRSLSRLSLLYDRIEQETEAFCQEYGVHCAFGCGTCCEHFMPDITPLEARMVAAYLLLVSKDASLREKLSDSHLDHCPLYDPSTPYHCQVYAARPLICRLFAQCASRAKNGDAHFHRCKFNKEKTMPEALVFPFSLHVRTMDEYGIELRSLSGGEEGAVEDLDEATRKALDLVGMVVSYLGDSGDGGFTPSPKACRQQAI